MIRIPIYWSYKIKDMERKLVIVKNILKNILYFHTRIILWKNGKRKIGKIIINKIMLRFW